MTTPPNPDDLLLVSTGVVKSKTPEYIAWLNMKARCYNPNATGYERYGGVGIVMCDEWRNSFEAFYRDMGPRPSKEHSVDQYPNRKGDYEPKNTRWATKKEQGRNKFTNVIFTLNGESKTCIEWSEIVDIDPSTLQARRYRGWTDEQILTTPLRSGRKGKFYAK